MFVFLLVPLPVAIALWLIFGFRLRFRPLTWGEWWGYVRGDGLPGAGAWKKNSPEQGNSGPLV